MRSTILLRRSPHAPESLEQRVEEGAFAASDAVHDLSEYLGLIKSEAFACKTITTDLLDFSRVRTGERSPVDAGDIVRSAANLISHQKRGAKRPPASSTSSPICRSSPPTPVSYNRP